MFRLDLIFLLFFINLRLLKAQYFFSNGHLELHAQKDISVLDQNVEKIEQLLIQLDTARLKIVENHDNTTASTPERAFMIWLDEQITTCITEIKSKKGKAEVLLKKIFRDIKHRDKRNIFGDAWSILTGMESPSASLHERKTVKKMQTILKGEMKELHTVQHVLSDELKAIDSVSQDVSVLTNKEFQTEKELELINYYLQTQHRIQKMCKTSHNFADKVMEEVQIVNEIKDKAKIFKASENLFPLEYIFKKVNEHKSNEHTPIFSNFDQLEQVYDMSKALTILNETKIVSILNIPLIDHTLEYHEVEIELKDEGFELLDNLRKSSHSSLDLFVCHKLDKTVKIMSRSQIQKCLKTYTNSMIICEGRELKQQSNDFTKPCNDLPEDMIIELKYNKILLKTNQKTVRIICGNYDETLYLNSSISILNLDPACKMIGKNFILEKVHKDFYTNFTSSPIENLKVSIESLPPPFNQNHLKKQFEEMEARNLNTTKMHQEIETLREQDKNNQNNYEEMKDDFQKHVYVNWTSIGLGIFFTTVILGCGGYKCYTCTQHY